MKTLVVYVDVDDTLFRSVGSKSVPMTSVIEHVRRLAEEGAELYCWSTGGADYARASAERAGLAAVFRGFLPKPHVMIDDQEPSEWRRLLVVHPMNCGAQTVDGYRSSVEG